MSKRLSESKREGDAGAMNVTETSIVKESKEENVVVERKAGRSMSAELEARKQAMLDEPSKGYYAILILCSLASLPLRAEVYDMMALELEIEKGYGISTMQYTFLFLAYYAASIITGMFIGFIADACGRRPVLIILYTINVLGFSINLLSAVYKSYTLLVIGRLAAGLVVESIIPILDDIVSDYSGKAQACSLSVRFSTGQFGMVLTLMFVPMVYNIRQSLLDAFTYMEALVLFGFVLSFVIIFIDSKARQPRELATCATVRQIPGLLIFSTISATLSAGAVMGFSAFMIGYTRIIEGWGIQMANLFFCIMIVTNFILCPLLGILIDKFGYQSLFLIIGNALNCISFVLFAYAPFCNQCGYILLPQTIQSFGQIFITPSSISMIPLLAPPNLRTFCFSIYRTLFAFWMKVFTVLARVMHDVAQFRMQGYYWMAMFLLFAELLAFVMLVVVMVIDCFGDKLLASKKSRVAMMDAAKKAAAKDLEEKQKLNPSIPELPPSKEAAKEPFPDAKMPDSEQKMEIGESTDTKKNR